MASVSIGASPLQRKRMLRKLCLLVHLVEGLIMCVLLFWRIKPHTKQMLTQRWSCKLLALFHASLVVHGEFVVDSGLAGSTLMSDHVSWIDIYAINGWYPSCPIVKPKIRNWSVIGWLCAQTGVLFAERARKRGTCRIMHVIADAMRSGDAIYVFLEGATSDGLQLLLFHANLLQAPASVGVSVRPLVLRYHIAVTSELTIIPVYIGGLPMADTANVMLNGPPLVVEVSVDPIVAPEMDRRVLAAHSRETVANLIACAD